jgi:hypothetical protein
VENGLVARSTSRGYDRFGFIDGTDLSWLDYDGSLDLKKPSQEKTERSRSADYRLDISDYHRSAVTNPAHYYAT